MARSLTARDRAALVALASALIALVWPLLESTGSGCPLGYGANETVARSFHDVPGTSSRVQNATVFARCAMWNVDGEKRDVIVSPSGRIVAVERSGKRRGEDETIVDCAGRVLASGFVDAHAHLIAGGFTAEILDMTTVRSKEEFIETLAGAIGEDGEDETKWVIGHGWDESLWYGETPTTAWLTERFDGARVWTTRVCGHVGFASEAALKAAGITKETNIPGGVIELDAAGRPTGVLKELATAAMREFLPKRTREERDRALRMGIKYMLKKGITSIGDFGDIESLVAGERGYAQLWEDFETLQRWDEEGSLPIRISSYMPLGDFKRVAKHRAWNGGWLREDIEGQFTARTRLGGVKAFLDGSLGGRTAAFVDAYSDEPSTKGKLMYPQGEEENYLREQSLAADELGLQIAFHAIGDAAVNQALDIAALLESSNGENKLRRLRVEHAQHLTSPIDEQMTRFRAVDAIASVQPAQIPLDERSVAEKLGEDRASRYYALRTFSDHEVPLAGGSDWPIVSADVFDAIKAAVDRERESLSIEEAMRMFTRGGARALRMDGLVGAISPGAFADFIVLDASPENILEKKPNVIATYVGGKCVEGSCL